MHVPEILKPFIEAGEKLNQQHCIKEVEFSGGTYQIQVVEKNQEPVWAFLQLDKRNILKDCFCSCQESEDLVCCPHIAAAYLTIFQSGDQPLHVRFEQSLWNGLCKLYADRLGDQPETLKVEGKGHFVANSVGGKNLFYIKGKNKEAIHHLNDLILHRHLETEETSLKFSNLSQDEILLWREGKPTTDLKYELSFWNDLAKWFFHLQNRGIPYQISFEYSSKHLPNRIHAAFPEVEFGFYLSEANLPVIIPSLSTVQSPLEVHQDYEDSIKRMIYDKGQGILKIELKKTPQQEKKTAPNTTNYLIGNWMFDPKSGFYPVHFEGFLAKSEVFKEQIDSVLTEHFYLVKSHLEGATLHDEPVEPSYALSFDKDWNLHITSYLFNEGDLTFPYSQVFGNWAYLDEDGFYHLENKVFDFVEKVVKEEEVADFVRQYRYFFNAQHGFKTHLTSIESDLEYQLDSDDRLTFVRRVALADDEKESKDFGSLVYFSGEGFYAKVNSPIGLPVRPDIAIVKDQIPLYIRMNREDLKHVPGFFSATCPVLRGGLSITLTDDQMIKILPCYDLDEKYVGKEVRYFDDFCFVPGEGFYELPLDLRLPEEYRYQREIPKENQALFLTYTLEKLKPFATSIDPYLLAPEKLELQALSIAKETSIGKGFYSLKLGMETEKGVISIYDLWAAIKKKKPFLFSKEGLIDLSLKRFDWLRLLDKKRVDRKSHTITLSTLELIRLNAFDEIHVRKTKGQLAEETVQLLNELTEFQIPDEPDLTGLKSSLRPYQEIGLRWLWFLYHHGLSGILSDDMGLGKTHQTMALIASIVNYQKKLDNATKKHFLVICPTSVIYHWQEKLAAFLPSLKVCTFHGSNRSLIEFHKDYDVLLTSYGIWRLENEFLSKFPFELAIFDEVQIAKNHHSRIYSSLTHVHAEMRIGLTGTPIENHLRELKTLFDIVVPTYMPPESDFREFFVKPIEKENDIKRLKLLSRFIKPFLLRRKKNQVLLDLPEKIEEVAHAELSEAQEQLYIEILEKGRSKIMQDLSIDSVPIPYMHIFSILSALKQICDHPAVFHKKPEKYHHYASGKWDLFVELLNEAKESGQKVVVFSQYLSMLDIIEEYLNENSIGYATIRGSTTNRGEQIHRFNHDPECEVFVASLQAAGLGVDLTAGSIVIHYDRWWNAARENQATDRVHRIGQTRGVQVFKLVTKNTIEEKIDQIIFRKGKMMEDVITVDDHQILKLFNRKELMELFQYTRLSD